MIAQTPQVATLDVKLCGPREERRKYSRTVEVVTSTTLHELHGIIQDLVDFDGDHLYLFFRGPRWNKQVSIVAEPAHFDNPGDYDHIEIGDIFPLERKERLFYLFDFGDSWFFEVSCNSSFKPIDRRCRYPRLVAKEGRNPKQYEYE